MINVYIKNAFGEIATGKLSNAGFPSGESNPVVSQWSYSEGTRPVIVLQFDKNGNKDLIDLAHIVDAYRFRGVKALSLYIPFFPGARQDRRSAVQTSFGTKVYADLINSMGFDRVAILEPHSDVIPALVERSTVINFDEGREWIESNDYDHHICPDAGASKRFYRLGGECKTNRVFCTKSRDATTGKLTATTVYGLCQMSNTPRAVIIDDIIDGGRTFINIANKIKESADQFSKNIAIDLCIPHAIFSAGIPVLLDTFKTLVVSDSYLFENINIADQGFEGRVKVLSTIQRVVKQLAEEPI